MRVKLEDVCERGTSSLMQKDIVDKNGKYPVYGASGRIGSMETYQQEHQTVAVVKDGAGIGRTMLLPEKSSIIGTMQYLIPKNCIEPEYLYYVVKYMHLEKYFSGATIPHIYFRDYKTEEFNLHDKTEQREIVSTLKRIEAIISNRQEQLTRLDELIKARFVEMFGDPKLNPCRFPCNSLSTYITFLTSGSRGWSQYFTDSGEYFITIKNVKNCKITLQDVQYVTPPDNAEAKRTKVQKNDLLISITADLGRTGVVTEEIANHGAYINQHLTCIRLKDEQVNPLYVAYYMESDAGKEQFTAKNQSAVKAGLNFNAINSLKLMVPPLSLQNQFATFVEEVDKSKVEVQKALDQTQLLFDSLMQQYFG